MPIRPSPTTYTCTCCGWFKTVAPKSDALMSGDYYTACPKCQHSPLKTSAATVAQVALGQLSRLVKQVLG